MPPPSKCYRVSRVPGKGLGGVATRDILPGECVVKEKPLVRLEMGESGDVDGTFDEQTGEFRYGRIRNQRRVIYKSCCLTGLAHSRPN